MRDMETSFDQASYGTAHALARLLSKDPTRHVASSTV